MVDFVVGDQPFVPAGALSRPRRASLLWLLGGVARVAVPFALGWSIGYLLGRRLCV